VETAIVAGHSHLRLPAEEPADFGSKTLRVATMAKLAGAIGLLVALVMGFFAGNYFKTFYFAYLTAFGFFLAIALGALFFVLIQHVTRAGWSVNVRRVTENMAALLPILGLLSAPIFISVIIQKGDLYRWALPKSDATAEAQHEAKHEPKPSAVPTAGEEVLGSVAGNQQISPPIDWQHDEEFKHEPDPGHGNRHLDEVTLKKRVWLNPLFFCIRLAAYFLIWSTIALYYLKQSTLQDADGDYRHTAAMQKYSGISLVLFGLTITCAAFDLFMSLDPRWYSTMFGVCYFASGVVAFFATTIVIIASLQRIGFLREAVTIEHYHDLGKFLFAFVFFWGYVTFSQYMLLWYASLPEEVTWPSRRGANTSHLTPVPNHGEEWRFWALLVLFGTFLIPFAGLLSRHMKRHVGRLLFWAVWLLVFQFVNMIWIVLPEMRDGFRFGPIVLSMVAWVGIGGVLTAAWLRLAARSKLRPVNDPRAFESAAFVNI
jgi:MFS family permease